MISVRASCLAGRDLSESKLTGRDLAESKLTGRDLARSKLNEPDLVLSLLTKLTDRKCGTIEQSHIFFSIGSRL